MRRSLILLLALATLPFVAIGCGGGTDATQGMTAEQVLTESAKRTEALTSYRFAIDVKAKAELDAAGALGDILSGPLDITGEGAAKDPGDFTFDVTVTLGPGPIQANITKVGGALYASLLGQAIKLDVDAAVVKALDATKLAPALAGWIKDPVLVGTEEVDGVPVVHIRGTVDEKALADDAGALLTGIDAGGAVTAAAAGGDQLEVATVDIWVGQEDLLLHRVHAGLVSKDALAAVPGLKSIDLDLTATLSGFDAPVDITAPAGARTVDLASITGLLGG